MARLLIFSGLLLVAIGLVIAALSRSGIPVGRLPGDIVLRGKNTTFYFPIVTCILLSLLGSLILWLLNRR